MLRQLYLLVIVLVLGGFFSSCSPRGCQDPTADNYEPKSRKPCDCCQYSGKAVFWYRQPVYDNFKSSGASSLIYKVNGQTSGTDKYINFYSDSPPTFASSKSDYNSYRSENDRTAIVRLGPSKSKKVLLSCEDQNGKRYWEDSVVITAYNLTACEIR